MLTKILYILRRQLPYLIVSLLEGCYSQIKEQVSEQDYLISLPKLCLCVVLPLVACVAPALRNGGVFSSEGNCSSSVQGFVLSRIQEGLMFPRLLLQSCRQSWGGVVILLMLFSVVQSGLRLLKLTPHTSSVSSDHTYLFGSVQTVELSFCH